MKFSAVGCVGGLPWTGMHDLDFPLDRIRWLDSHSPAAPKDTVVILHLSPVSLQLLQVNTQIFERFLQTPLSPGKPDLSYSEEKMTLSQDPRILRSCPRLYTDAENNTCWKNWGSGHRTRDKIACPFQSRGHPLACLLWENLREQTVCVIVCQHALKLSESASCQMMAAFDFTI